MKYCSDCGARLYSRIPPGDKLVRHVCSACGMVHYQNPRLIVGTLPLRDDKILLCRRAIEPAMHQWTLPGGFLEREEPLHLGALRETLEETGAPVHLKGLFSIYNSPAQHLVTVFFLAELETLEWCPGEETEALKLFSAESIPWDHLAFDAVHFTLNHWSRKTTPSAPYYGTFPE